MMTRRMVDDCNAACESEEVPRTVPRTRTRMRFWLKGPRPYSGPIVPPGLHKIMEGLDTIVPPAGKPWFNKAEWVACMRGMADYFEKAWASDAPVSCGGDNQKDTR